MNNVIMQIFVVAECLVKSKMPKKSGANLGRSLLRKKHNNFTSSTRHTTIDETDGMFTLF